MALAFDGSGNLKDRFLYGPAVDQILADEQVTSLGSAGTVYWMLADQEGTIRDVIDSGGTLQQHVSYDSFGKPTGTPTFDFGYTGKFYDNLTGLQWNLNRWYNPEAQRWMSQDPLGLGPDSDPYRYCGNNPTNHTDSSGEVWYNPFTWIPDFFWPNTGQPGGVEGPGSVPLNIRLHGSGSKAVNIWRDICKKVPVDAAAKGRCLLLQKAIDDAIATGQKRVAEELLIIFNDQGCPGVMAR
jgi:RHS repeat-associated protein